MQYSILHACITSVYFSILYTTCITSLLCAVHVHYMHYACMHALLQFSIHALITSVLHALLQHTLSQYALGKTTSGDEFGL